MRTKIAKETILLGISRENEIYNCKAQRAPVRANEVYPFLPDECVWCDVAVNCEWGTIGAPLGTIGAANE